MTWTLQKLTDFILAANRIENRPEGVLVYLAGGALRDVFLGRAEDVRDLDLWVHCPDLEQAREAFLASGFYGERVRSIGTESTALGRGGDICAIDYFVKDGQEINIIYMASPFKDVQELTDAFDFSVNQIGLEPDGLLYTSKAFLEDTPLELLRVLRKDTGKRGAKRLEHMLAKFPTWRYIDEVPDPPPSSSLSNSSKSRSCFYE